MHDASPSGPKQYAGFLDAVRCIHRTHGFFGGFFCGLAPNTLKVAVNGGIRFTLFNYSMRHLREPDAMEGGCGGAAAGPPAVWHSLASGAFAGAVSACVTHPLDTIKANMMGLESARYTSGWQCLRHLVTQGGGVACLYHGLQPRMVRVMLEVSLQFALFAKIQAALESIDGGGSGVAQ